MWGQTYSEWAYRVAWIIICLYWLFSPGCRWNESWSAVRRKGAAWHAGVWAPSEVISYHCLSKRKHQHIPKTHAKGALRLAFCRKCKNMTTAARQHHNQLMLLQLTIGSPSNFSFYVLKFLSVYFCSSPEKGWSSFFSSCSFIYISSYLEVTAVVNIVSACVVMCVVPVSLLLMPLFSICLCYVCLRFSFLHSCFGKLLFCLLHLPLVWCLARGAASLCSWYHVSVLLVIFVFFMAFWCWCCVHSGLSHRHLWFYLCIIFRVISALLSICYHMPQSRWWPFSLTAL